MIDFIYLRMWDKACWIWRILEKIFMCKWRLYKKIFRCISISGNDVWKLDGQTDIILRFFWHLLTFWLLGLAINRGFWQHAWLWILLNCSYLSSQGARTWPSIWCCRDCFRFVTLWYSRWLGLNSQLKERITDGRKVVSTTTPNANCA